MNSVIGQITEIHEAYLQRSVLPFLFTIAISFSGIHYRDPIFRSDHFMFEFNVAIQRTPKTETKRWLYNYTKVDFD